MAQTLPFSIRLVKGAPRWLNVRGTVSNRILVRHSNINRFKLNSKVSPSRPRIPIKVADNILNARSEYIFTACTPPDWNQFILLNGGKYEVSGRRTRHDSENFGADVNAEGNKPPFNSAGEVCESNCIAGGRTEGTTSYFNF